MLCRQFVGEDETEDDVFFERGFLRCTYWDYYGETLI